MADNLDALASNTVSRSVLSEEQLRKEVAALGARWSIDGENLKLRLEGAPMAKYGAAAAHAATLADEMDHHPTIVLEYAAMTLTIHTHDKKAITLLDLVYAARLERWLRTAGW
ncbi:MAG TPA: 4a-hydroxytetrahydrobiopterin dehydratase [Kofleriaceae bacterium]|nr:4a-hydroxytetrahydrobiopterin dehydratase [Kofleriaceae bacterium]